MEYGADGGRNRPTPASTRRHRPGQRRAAGTGTPHRPATGCAARRDSGERPATELGSAGHHAFRTAVPAASGCPGHTPGLESGGAAAPATRRRIGGQQPQSGGTGNPPATDREAGGESASTLGSPGLGVPAAPRLTTRAAGEGSQRDAGCRLNRIPSSVSSTASSGVTVPGSNRTARISSAIDSPCAERTVAASELAAA